MYWLVEMWPDVHHVQFTAVYFAQRGEYQRAPHAQALGRHPASVTCPSRGKPLLSRGSKPFHPFTREQPARRPLPPALSEPVVYALRQSGPALRMPTMLSMSSSPFRVVSISDTTCLL